MATATQTRQPEAMESVAAEAVFISGPRRGQIVSVPNGEITIGSGENVLVLTDEQAKALEQLALELTKAASGMGEVVAQAERLNSKMKEINQRLTEPT